MNRPKKAQITMFVILGIVLLIIFVILLAIKKSAEPETISVQELLNELKTGSIKNHVTACIIETSMDGLKKIGDNGGVIYDFQGGTIPFNKTGRGVHYLNYTYLNIPYFVAYALKENTLCKNVTYKIPDYPYPKKPFNALNPLYDSECLFDSFYSAYDGFFGQNTMNKLCYVARESSCEGFAKGLELGLTIQRQLEDYVANKTPLCVNFSAFTTRMPVDITPESKPVVEASIHESEVVLLVKYPLTIQFEDQEPITRIVDYYATLNVRLGLIYNFLYNTLSLDSKNIGFDLDNEFIASPYWKSGLEVKKIKDPLTPCSTCFEPYFSDDILEVLDRNSLVKGRPYAFRVAIRNRKPAIDFIQNVSLDTKNAHFLNIPFKAYDPDDRGLRYYFLSLGVGRHTCALTPPLSVVSKTIGGWCERDTRLISNLSKERLWAPINKYDSGEHEVGVLVIDDSGLFDYQFFWINITDTSTAKDPTLDCISACVDCGCAGQTYTECNNWCTIAANQCGSECGGGDFSQNSDCWSCVYSIINAKKHYKHVNCPLISHKSTCINHMPDCFWVKEKKDSGFVESCHNDTNLKFLTYPSYIITY